MKKLLSLALCLAAVEAENPNPCVLTGEIVTDGDARDGENLLFVKDLNN